MEMQLTIVTCLKKLIISVMGSHYDLPQVPKKPSFATANINCLSCKFDFHETISSTESPCIDVAQNVPSISH